MTILLLAGLQSLSREVYEAAFMDGASRKRAFFDMTLPLMKPFIFLAVFLRFIDAFKLFDLVFIVTRLMRRHDGEYRLLYLYDRFQRH